MKWIRDVIVGLVVIIAVGACVYAWNNKPYEPCYRECEQLKYYDLQYQIVNNTQRYIDSIAPASSLHAIRLLQWTDKYNIDIRLARSQARVESNFGTAGMAVKTNNPFNSGAFDQTTYDKIMGIYKFEHPDLSIEPYCKLISSRYLVNNKDEEDLLHKFVDKDGKRYASSIDYEGSLQRVWQDVDTCAHLGTLYPEYEKTKTELGY
jgi:hypothetical protein